MLSRLPLWDQTPPWDHTPLRGPHTSLGQHTPWDHTLFSDHTPPRTTHTHPLEGTWDQTGNDIIPPGITKAGGTHPTGMFSCVKNCLLSQMNILS